MSTSNHQRTYLGILTAVIVIGAGVWAYAERDRPDDGNLAVAELDETSEQLKLQARVETLTGPTLPDRAPLPESASRKPLVPDQDRVDALSTVTLMAALENLPSFDAALVEEALNRWNRCARYENTSNPEYRQERLNRLADDLRRRKTYLERWAQQDAQCPDMSPELRSVAMEQLLRHAENGNLQAQTLYYERGRLPIAKMVQNPAAAAEFVQRMRDYVEPMIRHTEPEHWSLLGQVYGEGLVFPSDHHSSAMYRFAMLYRDNPTPVEIEQTRLIWGQHLTDAQLDAAEQAGYQLYLTCCGG